jgi:hypothetical protein
MGAFGGKCLVQAKSGNKDCISSPICTVPFIVVLSFILFAVVRLDRKPAPTMAANLIRHKQPVVKTHRNPFRLHSVQPYPTDLTKHRD